MCICTCKTKVTRELTPCIVLFTNWRHPARVWRVANFSSRLNERSLVWRKILRGAQMSCLSQPLFGAKGPLLPISDHSSSRPTSVPCRRVAFQPSFFVLQVRVLGAPWCRTLISALWSLFPFQSLPFILWKVTHFLLGVHIFRPLLSLVSFPLEAFSLSLAGSASVLFPPRLSPSLLQLPQMVLCFHPPIHLLEMK